MRLATRCLFASILLMGISPVRAGDGVPVFKIEPTESSVKFDVEASVAIKGTFEKWEASLTFTSPEVSSGVLDIKIQADSVDTGSGMKNNKLKSEKFFDVKQNPVITFHSNKIVQTGPDTFDVDGDFTIRGVSKAEKLTLKVEGAGTGAGVVNGAMAFDRKQYGMKSGIPFIKIADRVEVDVKLRATRVGGPAVALKQ